VVETEDEAASTEDAEVTVAEVATEVEVVEDMTAVVAAVVVGAEEEDSRRGKQEGEFIIL
jgi:hypothetical protein